MSGAAPSSEARNADDEAFRSALAAVPGWPEAIVAISILTGGLTNRSYRITTRNDGEYVVRVPGAQTELLGIDRRAEVAITTAVASLGLAPKTLCEIPEFGTVVSAFVDARAATPDDVRDPLVLEGVVRSLRSMHGAEPVPYAFPIFDIVRRHAADAARFGVEDPNVPGLLSLAARIEASIDAAGVGLVLGHNDLLPANVLVAPDGRLWLIDFEYAGMNHPSFDLANLSINAGFDAHLDEALLAGYFGTVTDGDRARHELMKIVSELREGLWGLVQSCISTSRDVDYVAYGASRLASCAALAEGENIGRWLAEASVR